MKRADGKLVIGWREEIALPDWKIRRLVAKADTGARSSAIDVTSVEELPGNRVRFTVALARGGRKEKAIEAPITRKTRVRSSLGRVQDRILVTTRIRVGPVTKLVEFGLARREKMLCRVLLGRTAMENDFVIDPSITHVQRP